MSSLLLDYIVIALGADSAAIMMPNETAKHLFCFDSYNMPKEWIEIKNSLYEKVPGGNVEVYKTGVSATSNHLRRMLKGFFIESVMILPIRREKTTIAMLEIIHYKDNKTFSNEDLQKAEAFAKGLEPKLP
jgi:hypothetical protein